MLRYVAPLLVSSIVFLPACAVEVEVSPTCAGEGCAPAAVQDVGGQDADVGVPDTEPDAEDSRCASATGPCLVEVWPPEGPRFEVRDRQLHASVNLSAHANFLFGTVVTWEDRQHAEVQLVMARPEYLSWTVPIQMAPDIYVAPALVYTASATSLRLTVPYDRMVPDPGGDAFVSTHMVVTNIASPARGFEPTVGTFSLGDVPGSTVLQPSVSAFIGDDLAGKIWVGANNIGRTAIWQIDGHLITETAVREGPIDECVDPSGRLRSERLITLSDVPGDPAYTWCSLTNGQDRFIALPAKNSLNHEAIDWATNPASPTLAARTAPPFFVRMVAPGGDPAEIAAATVAISDGPRAAPVTPIAAAIDAFVQVERQPGGCLASLAPEAELEFCPSDVDGVALADLDGDRRPELVALIRLSTSCQPEAADPMPTTVTTLATFQIDGAGGVFARPFSASRQTSQCLPGYAVGPLAGDLDGDGRQEFLVGLLQDTRLGRIGTEYDMRMVDDTGDASVFLLPDVEGDEVGTTFDVPVALGEFVQDPQVDALELAVLRIEGRGTASEFKRGRVLVFSLVGTGSDVALEWPFRLADPGLSGIWGLSP